jgi:hypothetical protein
MEYVSCLTVGKKGKKKTWSILKYYFLSAYMEFGKSPSRLTQREVWFEYRSGHQIFFLRIFVIFLRPSRKMSG